MARARTQNRMEKRAEHEAYERQQAGEEEDRDDDEEEDEDEPDDDEEAVADDEEELGDDEEAPPKKKKKPAKEPKEPKKARPRSRAAKVVRMKLVWKVFDNSNRPVATYEYPQRREAEEHATRLTTDKKSTHFVQPVKEALEEKKE